MQRQTQTQIFIEGVGESEVEARQVNVKTERGGWGEGGLSGKREKPANEVEARRSKGGATLPSAGAALATSRWGHGGTPLFA